MVSRHIFGIVLLLLSLSPRAVLAQTARTQVSLDGRWKFSITQAANDTTVGFDDGKMEEVSVPHSWPAEGRTLPDGGFRANATYRRTFLAPPAWRSKRVVLQFDAVSLTAEVYLNGALLGKHQGGFAAFNFDITDALKWGIMNTLALHVSNAANPDVAPLSGDFTLYGGIYRHVSLLILDPVHVNVANFASPGVFLDQSMQGGESGQVEARVEVANQSETKRAVHVVVLVRDQSRRIVASSTHRINVQVARVWKDTHHLQVAHPHHWNGVADPYLYTVEISILRDGHLSDRVLQPLGFRTETFDPYKGFVLNGRAMQIRGVCLHQEGAAAGWAVTDDDEARDMNLIRAMGADGIRLAHYQHSQSFLDLADRTGTLLWVELAQVDHVTASEAYRENIRQQLKELIRQNYNHPSIFVWSLYNELNSKTKETEISLVAELNVLAHQEDRTRPTSGADSLDTIEHLQPMVAGLDLISLNVYPGWYVGAPEDMGDFIDRSNAAYGNRGIGITEYGAGASVMQHVPNATKGDVEVRGHVHPEEWQAFVHEGNYAEISRRPQVWGSFVWNMFDFSSSGRHEGDADGVNDKGLITRDRAIRKDAYFFYQANWTRLPMAHLVGCSDKIHRSEGTMLKAYSNQRSLTLALNGDPQTPVEGSATHVFQWLQVHVPSGPTVIELSSSGQLLDRCELQ